MAIAFDLKYVEKEDYDALEAEVYQVLGLLNRLIESLRRAQQTPT